LLLLRGSQTLRVNQSVTHANIVRKYRGYRASYEVPARQKYVSS
jgi:hypothetical protein